MDTEQSQRQSRALDIVDAAAAMALAFFRDIDALHIEEKGAQDLVSNADRSVETYIRNKLNESFPEDGIIGEEHANTPSASGYTWIIDPIDGTANFVHGMPGWCVVLACVKDDQAIIGIIRDAVADETFMAARAQGATLNGRTIKASASKSLNDGSTGVGYSIRVDSKKTLSALAQLMNAGGVFYRNASGALMLSYVASGRLIGYCEPHMNSWDCVAGLLMIEEAGGVIYPYAMPAMLDSGAVIIAGGQQVYPQLEQICEMAFEL